MQCSWMGERVAQPDVKTATSNVLRKKVAGNWGPNATFRFPAKNGTGGIWSSVASTLPKNKLNFQHVVERVDEDKKVVTFQDGTTVRYNNLITTMPLDTLASKLNDKAASQTCQELFYSTTHVVCIGVRGTPPAHVGDTCWVRMILQLPPSWHLDYE